MRRFPALLLATLFLSPYIFCNNDKGEAIKKATACLHNYRKVIQHNVSDSHFREQIKTSISAQKKLHNLSLKLKEGVSDNREGFKEANKEFENAILEMRKDKQASKYFEKISQNCNPQQEFMMQELNTEESEEFEKH